MAMTPAVPAVNVWDAVSTTDIHSNISITRNLTKRNPKTKEVVVSLVLSITGTISKNTKLLKFTNITISDNAELNSMVLTNDNETSHRAVVTSSLEIRLPNKALANGDALFINGVVVSS